VRQMDEKVGIRELRQSLSVYLRRVAEGSRFTITDHNVPVAKLVPLGHERGQTWDEVKRRLNIQPAKKDPLAIWDRPRLGPRVRKPGEPRLDEILDELREDRL
jgi:prevent-host-death family protein